MGPRLVGGKSKDKGKGFEVVRSSRMPPDMMRKGPEDEGQELQTSPPMTYPPYLDSPDPQAYGGAERSGAVSPIEHEQRSRGKGPAQLDGTYDSDEESVSGRVSPVKATASSPPFLKPISRTGSIQLPLSRPSLASNHGRGSSRDQSMEQGAEPTVPPKSNRRTPSQGVNYLPPAMETEAGPADVGRRPWQDRERPTSTGEVQHYLTGDSMFESGHHAEGRKAEFLSSSRSERTLTLE
ncbi:hypothetical protein H2203_006734 [Taxawa tesnikishii (nom. ined.)]|nr:hypothetical protein H2203_006734 [Dothideales sp. JES 119]